MNFSVHITTELAVILVWKLWTVYARMFAVTAILSCVINIRGLFKSTKWRHFENVKFGALSARRVNIYLTLSRQFDKVGTVCQGRNNEQKTDYRSHT